MPYEISPINVVSEYVNNTLVSKKIGQNEIQIDSGPQDVITDIRRQIITTVELQKRANFELSEEINSFDMNVLDAVSTIYQHGYATITAEMVARVLTGNHNSKKISPARVTEIRESLDKLTNIRVTIDYLKEANRRSGKKFDEFKVESYLFPADKVTARFKANGKTIEAYHLLRTPALFEYAKEIGQIISYPVYLLNSREKMSDSDDTVLIKRYLIKRIEQMKNKKNNIMNHKISYQWVDNNTGKIKGMYQELGYSSEKYSNWRKKRSSIHGIVKNHLDYLIEVNYIKGYIEIKEKNTINGVEITF